MFAMKFIVLAGLAALATAGPTREGRQFLPTDITGKYNRFVKQGTCAKTVTFKSMMPAGEGAYTVPHSKIVEEGNTCSGDGFFTVFTKEAIVESNNGMIFEQEPLKKVFNTLEAQGATFMLGVERTDRNCGPSMTHADTIAIFVEEEKKIEIPNLITLYPGAKYMIVYEPTSPTPCTYFAKYEDRVIGIPGNADTDAEATEDVPKESMEASHGSHDGHGDSHDEHDESHDGHEEHEGHSDSHDEHDESHDGHDGHGDHGDMSESSEESDSGSNAGVAGGVAGGVAAAGGAIAAGVSVSGDDDMGTDGSDDSSEPLGVSMSDEPGATEEDDDDDGSVCFPASATVQLEDGSVKRMDQIAIGDRVRVGTNEFSPVFMFTHKNAGGKYSFVQVNTASGVSLSLTKGHYLYVNGQLAAAKSIRVGDVVMTEGGSTTVSAVSEISDVGLYNPQTVQGDIVVNRVLASTYTTTVEAKAAHSLLLPVRAFFGLTGMTSSLFENGADNLAQMIPSGGVIA